MSKHDIGLALDEASGLTALAQRSGWVNLEVLGDGACAQSGGGGGHPHSQQACVDSAESDLPQHGQYIQAFLF
jgi:hypothetical protein